MKIKFSDIKAINIINHDGEVITLDRGKIKALKMFFSIIKIAFSEVADTLNIDFEG